jgi:hypothetical protein
VDRTRLHPLFASHRGLSLCCQMNPFWIGEAKHQSPSEEVVCECYRDLIIARFQRQREGAILQRTSPAGLPSRALRRITPKSVSDI